MASHSATTNHTIDGANSSATRANDNSDSLSGQHHPSQFTIQYPIRSGVVIAFDASPKACEPFGFFCGDRVQVRGGRNAWAIGVRQNNLFFHIDGDAGASYYNGYTKQEFLRDGFKLVLPRFRETAHLDNNGDDDDNNNNSKGKPHVAPSLKALLEDATFSDISFQVDNRIVPAHKNILVSRSAYFRAMFTGGMKENKQAVIPLPHVDPETFTSVLEFLYTGHVTLHENNVVSLINAADMFQLEDLKALCLDRFNTVVTEYNVINLLLMAAAQEEKELRACCERFIMAHYDQMVRSDSFKQLISPENATLLLQIMGQLKPSGAVSTMIDDNKVTKKRKVAAT